jgi:hypothetical protein
MNYKTQHRKHTKNRGIQKPGELLYKAQTHKS